MIGDRGRVPTYLFAHNQDPKRTSTVGEPHMQPVERFSTLPQSLGQFTKLAASARCVLERSFLPLSETACPGF